MTAPVAMTPAERKRQWMIDWLLRAGIGWWLVALGLVAGIGFGAWPASLAPARLDWLAWIAIGAMVLHAVSLFAFALGGPIGRWSMKFRGLEIEAEDDAGRQPEESS